MKTEKKFATIAAVVEATCAHADVIIVLQTEDMLTGEWKGMRAVCHTWVPKQYADIIARSLGCKSLSSMIGKSVMVKLKETSHVFPDVVGIYPTTMNLVKLVEQPMPSWISKWKTGRVVSPCMKLQ